MLMAVPNVSEGLDPDAIAAIGAAFACGARLLDTHSDPDHGRSVYTLAAPQGQLARALVEGARAAVAHIDLTRHSGDHPHVGALDVAPVVYRERSERGAACAEALTAGALIAEELGLPVYLYGELAQGRERHELRRGGLAGLADITPDFCPPEIDARRAVPHPPRACSPPEIAPRSAPVWAPGPPPLIAFNVDLATDDVELAKEI